MSFFFSRSTLRLPSSCLLCVSLTLSFPEMYRHQFQAHISRYLFRISNWTAQHHMHEATFFPYCLFLETFLAFPSVTLILGFKSPFLWLFSLLSFLHLSCCQDSLGWDTVGQSSIFPPLMLMSFHNCPSSCSDSLAKYWSFYILLLFLSRLFSPIIPPLPAPTGALCQARLAH